VIDEQPDVELGSGQPGDRNVSRPSRSAARAIETASMASDLPRSRAERRAPATSFGATRTTCSPRLSRKRSSAPETWRQSSIAHTRSPSRPRAQTSRSSNDLRLALTVRSARAAEILAGIIVALKPRYGAYIVAAWLAGIVINLVTYSGFYDVALRDFGLMLAALTLARLASVYDPPLRRRRQLTKRISSRWR
jgi:hypothetical protein